MSYEQILNCIHFLKSSELYSQLVEHDKFEKFSKTHYFLSVAAIRLPSSLLIFRLLSELCALGRKKFLMTYKALNICFFSFTGFSFGMQRKVNRFQSIHFSLCLSQILVQISCYWSVNIINIIAPFMGFQKRFKSCECRLLICMLNVFLKATFAWEKTC